MRLDPEPGAAREVDRDREHQPEHHDLAGEQKPVRHETGLPLLHRRQPFGATEHDDDLAGDAADEQDRDRPEKRCVRGRVHLISRTSRDSAGTTRSGSPRRGSCSALQREEPRASAGSTPPPDPSAPSGGRRGSSCRRCAMARSISARNVSAAAAIARRRVIDVQIEHDAGEPVARPRQKRLVVALDEPHRAVDEVGATRDAAQRARLLHETGEPLARDVDLRDHFRARHARAARAIDGGVVAVDVRRSELRVRPVHLPGRLQVAAGVALERPALVGVGVEHEALPFVGP